jgi:hypothetical protein
MISAYFQLGLDEKSKQKTAFITHANLYQFKRMLMDIAMHVKAFKR